MRKGKERPARAQLEEGRYPYRGSLIAHESGRALAFLRRERQGGEFHATSSREAYGASILPKVESRDSRSPNSVGETAVGA